MPYPAPWLRGTAVVMVVVMVVDREEKMIASETYTQQLKSNGLWNLGPCRILSSDALHLPALSS